MEGLSLHLTSSYTILLEDQCGKSNGQRVADIAAGGGKGCKRVFHKSQGLALGTKCKHTRNSLTDDDANFEGSKD